MLRKCAHFAQFCKKKNTDDINDASSAIRNQTFQPKNTFINIPPGGVRNSFFFFFFFLFFFFFILFFFFLIKINLCLCYNFN